jgi:restriction system protein
VWRCPVRTGGISHPPEPRGLRRFLARFLGGAARRRQAAQAQSRFEAATAEHRQDEAQRQQALAAAKAKYHGKVSEERARAAARNAHVAGKQEALDAGDVESVEWFVRCVLKASRYPDGFPRGYQVAYDPNRREVAVEFELPPRSVVPSVRTCRYVQARDVIESLPRPDHEITKRYERLVSAITLRTLHEIFSATAPEVVQAVSFTGYVSTTDRATGKPVRPQLVRVSAGRPAFEELVLAAVEPTACLAHLGAPALEPETAEPETAEPGPETEEELGLPLGPSSGFCRPRCRQKGRPRPSPRTR